MVTRPKRPSRLQDRDYEILDHVNLYRMTTREILHALFFEDSELNAATKVTSRLCKDGYLERYPFFGTSSYYGLGKRGARIFGVRQKLVKPMGPQSLYMGFATLGFCFKKIAARRRLSVAEIRRSFPQLLVKGMSSSCYVREETEGSARVLALSIDGSASTDYVIRKSRQMIADRSRVPVFAALMEQARFALAIVTYHPEREAVLAAMVKKEKLPCEVFVEAVPALHNLLIESDV